MWRGLGLLTIILAAQSVRAEEWRWDDVPRVVAFGDVHGAYSALVELLQATGVVGPDLRWAGAARIS